MTSRYTRKRRPARYERGNHQGRVLRGGKSVALQGENRGGKWAGRTGKTAPAIRPRVRTVSGGPSKGGPGRRAAPGELIRQNWPRPRRGTIPGHGGRSCPKDAQSGARPRRSGRADPGRGAEPAPYIGRRADPATLTRPDRQTTAQAGAVILPADPAARRALRYSPGRRPSENY